ncbi:hypothetical protein HMPREF3037_03168, partial [Candidatus Stoquefichus sp. KLE1796]
ESEMRGLERGCNLGLKQGLDQGIKQGKIQTIVNQLKKQIWICIKGTDYEDRRKFR